MITLKQAKKEGKLEDFIKEHEQDTDGDAEKFSILLDVISHPEKLRSTQGTSAEDSSESSNDIQSLSSTSQDS